MELGKCMHGNGPECERCKAMDIPEVEEMEVTITELRAEVEAAKEQLEFDRTTCAGFVTALDKALDSRFWLTEGRGSYQWDDDRYREEFRDAAVALKAVIEPMRKMACNLSSGLQTTEQVVKARVDLLARLEAAEREREELQALIDLQHKRVVEANRLWRVAHPGNDLVMPDLGRLVEWLMSRAEASESTAAGLRLALEGLIAAAECIRHWHDTGKDGEGMIVSNAKVHELWAETAKAHTALAASPDEHARRIKAEARAVADRYQKADDAAVQLLEKAKLTLEVPAAEYVPAISDAWQLIENALEKIR